MAEILHQLRLVVYPIIDRVLYIPGGCLGFQPSTVYPKNGEFNTPDTIWVSIGFMLYGIRMITLRDQLT